MRDYVLRVLAISLFTSLCDFFLPEGSVRRFASPILRFAVIAAILLPLPEMIGSLDAADALLPAVESVLEGDLYAKSVEEEYKKRIAAEISARGGAEAEITLGDNFAVDRIVLSGNVTSEAMFYITAELGVPRKNVEIR